MGIYVATIFGSAFFFDLFWPERNESKSVRLAWRICSVFACMLTLACALAYTYIVATKSAYVTGFRAREVRLILERQGKPALKYRKNARAIASVVFLWPGMVFTFARYTYPLLLLGHTRTYELTSFVIAHISSGNHCLILLPTAPNLRTRVTATKSRNQSIGTLPVQRNQGMMELRRSYQDTYSHIQKEVLTHTELRIHSTIALCNEAQVIHRIRLLSLNGKR